MGRQDQVGALRDIQVFPVVDAKGRNGFAFPFQRDRVKDDAIADQVDGAFVKDPGWDLMKDDLFIFTYKVCPALGPP